MFVSVRAKGYLCVRVRASRIHSTNWPPKKQDRARDREGASRAERPKQLAGLDEFQRLITIIIARIGQSVIVHLTQGDHWLVARADTDRRQIGSSTESESNFAEQRLVFSWPVASLLATCSLRL